MARSWFVTCVVGLALLPGCRHAGRRDTVRAEPVAEAPAPSPSGPALDCPPALECPPPPDCPVTPSSVPETPPEETGPVAPPRQPELSQSAHGDLFNAIREELARLRCAVEPGAEPEQGHAPDYSWLVGELHYLEVRQVWRLRYAPVEEEDRYGGSVTLTENGPMSDYRSGQRVRVQGQLVDPDSRDPSPAYCVRSMEPLPSP
jgi:hypothetical protein